MRFLILTTITSLLFTSAALAEVNLTPEAIEGKWCLEYIENQGNKTPENMNYEFTSDGKYKEQQSQYSDKMMEGKYTITGNMLKLSPKMMNLEVKELTQEKMVTKWFVNQHFKKGTCS